MLVERARTFTDRATDATSPPHVRSQDEGSSPQTVDALIGPSLDTATESIQSDRGIARRRDPSPTNRNCLLPRPPRRPRTNASPPAAGGIHTPISPDQYGSEVSAHIAGLTRSTGSVTQIRERSRQRPMCRRCICYSGMCSVTANFGPAIGTLVLLGATRVGKVTFSVRGSTDGYTEDDAQATIYSSGTWQPWIHEGPSCSFHRPRQGVNPRA